jgi:hypothetical protein
MNANVFDKAALSWYSLRARIEALNHILRGHDVRWRVNADEHSAGDIRCANCPDIEDHEGTGLLIWYRGRKSSDSYFQGDF